MKKLTIILLLGLFAACSSEKQENTASDDEILGQIDEYKQQIRDLNQKIEQLESQLSSESLDNGVAVSVEKIEPGTFNHFIEVNGVAEAINEAFISPETNGQIKKIYVTEGQRVNQGDRLVKINSSVTESTILEVKTNLDLAKTVYSKQKELWDKNIGSEMDYLRAKNNVESLESRLETLRAQLDMSEIKAPISGIIDDVSVKEGELAVPGQQVIRMVNLSNMYINADVSEAYIQNVKEGEKVLLNFPAYPDMKMEVEVHRTGNVIKSANRTFKMQLKVPNREGKIKPNMLAKIRINDYTRDNVLIVPSIVIKHDMNGSYLYVVDQKDKTAKKVYVETGRTYNDKTVVSGGIEPGTKVIVEGYNQISNGSRLKITG